MNSLGQSIHASTACATEIEQPRTIGQAQHRAQRHSSVRTIFVQIRIGSGYPHVICRLFWGELLSLQHDATGPIAHYSYVSGVPKFNKYPEVSWQRYPEVFTEFVVDHVPAQAWPAPRPHHLRCSPLAIACVALCSGLLQLLLHLCRVQCPSLVECALHKQPCQSSARFSDTLLVEGEVAASLALPLPLITTCIEQNHRQSIYCCDRSHML